MNVSALDESTTSCGTPNRSRTSAFVVFPGTSSFRDASSAICAPASRSDGGGAATGTGAAGGASDGARDCDELPHPVPIVTSRPTTPAATTPRPVRLFIMGQHPPGLSVEAAVFPGCGTSAPDGEKPNECKPDARPSSNV